MKFWKRKNAKSEIEQEELETNDQTEAENAADERMSEPVLTKDSAQDDQEETQVVSEDAVVFRVVAKTAEPEPQSTSEQPREKQEVQDLPLEKDGEGIQEDEAESEELSVDDLQDLEEIEIETPKTTPVDQEPSSSTKSEPAQLDETDNQDAEVLQEEQEKSIAKNQNKKVEPVVQPTSPLSEQERLWLRQSIDEMEDKKQRKKGWDLAMILLEEILILVATISVGTFFPNSALIIPMSAVALVVNLLRIWYSDALNKGFDFLYKWRWLIALIVFALLVLAKVHTSNAAAYMYNFQADPSVENSIFFGRPRLIRTDEYVVQLPYYWSQFYNDFQEISHQMSVSGQNMILGYNAPVRDITMIGKPFVLGYLLLGNEYGISWYFCAKTILMFMVAIEMFNILVKNRYLAVFGAFVLTFAPATQWWYSPHFYDVIFWACTLFVVGYWFFMACGWKKWLMTILAICSLTGFVLAIFPSLQVPLGMLAFFLMIACLIRDRDQLQFKKTDLFNVIVVIAGVGIVLGPTLWGMRDDIQILMNTAYPGSRVSVGGDGQFWRLFVNPVSIMQSFLDPALLNNSEISSYTHFGIACMMFYPFLRFALFKKKDRQAWVGDVLMIAMIIEVTFMFVQFPEWLSKLMLLSYCNRMNTVFGVTATIFTIWMIQVAFQTEMRFKKTIIFLVFAVYACGAFVTVKFMDIPHFNDFIPQGSLVVYGFMIGITVAFYLTMTRFRQLGLAGMILWTACSGCLVNPIMIGSASVTDYPIAKKTRQLVEENPDAWWAYMGSNIRAGLLTANGAKVINGVNFYPDFEKWEMLDPDLIDSDTINRYAHIQMTPTPNQETEVVLNRPDLVTVHIDPYDLEKWDVRYLMADEDYLPALDAVELPYDILYQDQEGQVILELEWK